MNRTKITPKVAALILAATLAAQEKPARTEPKPADPVSSQFAATLAKARTHNKRVLAVFAPKEKAATTAIAAARKGNAELNHLVLYEFEVACFDASAVDLATRIGIAGELAHPPVIAVLDADGKHLATLPRELWSDEGLDATALLETLTKQTAPPADAAKKLEDGIALAKKTGRNVFVRFDAPW